MPQAFSSGGKTMEAWPRFPSGMTFAPLTEPHGQALLTWYRAASPVRTYPEQVLAQESTASGLDSGERWPASWVKFDPASCSWKTAQGSLLGDSVAFWGTWPNWGSMRNGECWALTTPALSTSGKESGFWPTVRASDGERGGRGDLIQAVRGNPNTHFKMHPTPTASNTKANHMRGADKGKPRESRSYGANGPLNPNWVEWLMGWPIRWTEFEPLETGRFHEWQQQHGACSEAP